MEMGSLAADGQTGDDDAAVAVSPEKDIMQLARIGDIVAMEKLFESGEFDATYSDDEGITPLHVSRPASKIPHPFQQCHCQTGERNLEDVKLDADNPSGLP